MRELWKKTAKLAGIGFVLGMLVGLCFLVPGPGIRAYYADHGAVGLALFMGLSGLLGAVNMGTTTIYELEKWSVLRCTLAHFAIAMSTYFAVGFTLDWLSLDEPWSFIMVPVCVVVYFIIWLIMYTRYKRQIRHINVALEQWKAKQRDE